MVGQRGSRLCRPAGLLQEAAQLVAAGGCQVGRRLSSLHSCKGSTAPVNGWQGESEDAKSYGGSAVCTHISNRTAFLCCRVNAHVAKHGPGEFAKLVCVC